MPQNMAIDMARAARLLLVCPFPACSLATLPSKVMTVAPARASLSLLSLLNAQPLRVTGNPARIACTS